MLFVFSWWKREQKVKAVIISCSIRLFSTPIIQYKNEEKVNTTSSNDAEQNIQIFTMYNMSNMSCETYC